MEKRGSRAQEKKMSKSGRGEDCGTEVCACGAIKRDSRKLIGNGGNKKSPNERGVRRGGWWVGKPRPVGKTGGGGQKAGI